MPDSAGFYEVLRVVNQINEIIFYLVLLPLYWFPCVDKYAALTVALWSYHDHGSEECIMRTETVCGRYGAGSGYFLASFRGFLYISKPPRYFVYPQKLYPVNKPFPISPAPFLGCKR